MKGTFARQITSSISGSQDLSKKFRNNQLGTTRVAVTVNMMTTGYDCTDLLNVVLMRPIFSITDFVQIKGRGTRRHTFSNELTGQKIEKENFYLLDFFGVCEYFEEKYDYKAPLKIPAKTEGKRDIEAKQEQKGKTVQDETGGEVPIAVSHGNYIYIGVDFLVRDNQLQIGHECMKVDREAYCSHFEESVKELLREEPAFKEALTKDDIDTTEEIVQEKLLGKPVYYFTIESLRKAYQATNPLIDFLKKAAGIIRKLPDKYDHLNQGFEEFKLIYPNTAYEKLNFFYNIYSCYLTSPEYRMAIDKGNLIVLDDQRYGGSVPIGRISKQEIDTVINYIKNSQIAYVN